jgi:hypothetical protein
VPSHAPRVARDRVWPDPFNFLCSSSCVRPDGESELDSGWGRRGGGGRCGGGGDKEEGV